MHGHLHNVFILKTGACFLVYFFHRRSTLWLLHARIADCDDLLKEVLPAQLTVACLVSQCNDACMCGRVCDKIQDGIASGKKTVTATRVV